MITVTPRTKSDEKKAKALETVVNWYLTTPEFLESLPKAQRAAMKAWATLWQKEVGEPIEFELGLTHLERVTNAVINELKEAL